MELAKTVQNEITVLRLNGDVMGGPEAVKLNDEINQLIDDKNLKVVIDLAEVQRMNSSGLGILINALSTFKQNGGDLKLASPTPLVKNLLKMTKLDNIFESYEGVESAVNGF